MGEASSSNLYLVVGKSMSGSRGFDGVRVREGNEEVEYDVDGREYIDGRGGGESQ